MKQYIICQHFMTWMNDGMHIVETIASSKLYMKNKYILAQDQLS